LAQDAGERSTFTPPPLFPREGPRFPLNRRFGGPHSRSGWFLDKKKSLALIGIRGPDCPACSLVTMPAILSRVFCAAYTFYVFLHIRARRWAFSVQTPPHCHIILFLSPVMCYQWYKATVATVREPYVPHAHRRRTYPAAMGITHQRAISARGWTNTRKTPSGWPVQSAPSPVTNQHRNETTGGFLCVSEIK